MSVPELEEYFNTIGLPATVQFGQGVAIVNVRGFIDSHLLVIKSNPNGFASRPFYNRLVRLKEMLSNNV